MPGVPIIQLLLCKTNFLVFSNNFQTDNDCHECRASPAQFPFYSIFDFKCGIKKEGRILSL